MQVNATVTIQPGDAWTLTPTEAADAVLKALGGDETKDTVNLNVVGAGVAGVDIIPTMSPAP